MQRLSSFIRKNKISMAYKKIDHNPHYSPERMEADHWICELRVPISNGPTAGPAFSRFRLHFTKGKGHHGKPPTRREVLDCLASDCSGLENARSFEEWCGEYGSNTDSLSAYRSFKTIQGQARRLKELLGSDAYEDLLWKTRRD